ncbi:MAG: family N-acetyltransferase [Microbacteriaceae bacterium]|nr:family N-acetyltransferase [Microbacteriaceae bacterium]
MRLVDTASSEFPVWLQAETRGFHGPRPSEESVGQQVRGFADRRTTGVFDESGADAASPISSASSWPTELTVPGQTSVTAWAISAVTVAPTHRRRGIARAMLEAELRTAQALGVPVAMLTVSEATIYSRYGFAPAAMVADWTIDTRRAKWTGPAAFGRVQFVTLEQALADGLELVGRARLNTPGEIEFSGYLWERKLGIHGDAGLDKQLRFVRYDDVAGVAQGLAIYRMIESPGVVFTHTLELQYLVTATDDAYAGLWRYLLEVDLVSAVSAELLSVDEAIVWQISDYRAARKTFERDHLWTRILDVGAALEARRYGAPGRILLDVSDPLGLAAGRVLMTIAADGSASATSFDGAIPDDAAALSLSVNELSAMYLGGVSALTLTRAGRIVELSPGAAVAVDASFRSAIAPRLSIWF